jgi:catalase
MTDLNPKDAIDAINHRFGRHKGFRALHAKGQFLKGSFTATPAAASLTRAAHMQGQPVEVTARFSNGGGDPTVPDFTPDVRGLAVSFHLPDGRRTDIVSQTAPRFPVRTPEAFIEFVRAMEPGLKQAWRLPSFLLRHPESLPALRASASALIKPPASYGSVPYYAVHSFLWMAADGSSRYVRYRWQPEKSATLSMSEAKRRGTDYLQNELRGFLQREPIRFQLLVQIADARDAVDDPLTHWPDERETVVAGTLELRELLPQAESAAKPFVFDPVRITDGIGLSRDPVLRYRTHAYTESVARRQG